MYARPVPKVRAVLQQIIRQQVPRGSTICSDGSQNYAGLLTNSCRHCLIRHAQMFAHSHCRHLNGIENFQSFAETCGAMSASDEATLCST